MPFNPFNEKAKGLENYLEPLQNTALKPFNNLITSPHTKLRLTAALAMEQSAVDLAKAFSANCNTEVRRALALMLQTDCRTKSKLLSLMPPQFTQVERALALELAEVSLLAVCAQNETHRYVKSSLNFLMIEDFGHLHRLIDFFSAHKHTKPVVDEMGEWLVFETLNDIRLEIARLSPAASQHGNPFDYVRNFLEADKTLTHTKLNVIIAAALQNFAASFYSSYAEYAPHKSGLLFTELNSVEEQHSTHINSLTDPSTQYADRLLLHKFAECYVYQSLFQEESEREIKALFRACLEKKISQIQYARKILNSFNRDYQDVLGDARLPPPFAVEKTSERNNFYIRHVLKNIGDKTMLAGEFVKADGLTKSSVLLKHHSNEGAPNSDIDSRP